jgi:hypothetical protein
MLDRQGGCCAYSEILALPFAFSPYTISIERKNVRLPYLERNMCLVIAVMNCIDLSGGTPYWEIKGERANHYLDYDIIHHVSCGWNKEMVKELRDKYSDKNEVGNKRKILVRYNIFVFINFFIYIVDIIQFHILLLCRRLMLSINTMARLVERNESQQPPLPNTATPV